jgi:energy-converting hydrogenase A subunit R
VNPIFISDCEGPLSKNDNAFEIASQFIPNGNKLFSKISKYDDVLADVLQRHGYSAGSTLKLILPFFKAYGVDDRLIEEFSANNIILIPNTKKMLHHVQTIASAFIVSTSYEHYIKVLCRAIDFPYENTYCTKLRLQNYAVTEQEQKRLKNLAKEIAQTHLITVPSNAKTTADFSRTDQETIQRLDEIFWGEIPKMTVGKLLSDVVTLGGEQKAEAVKDAAKRFDTKLENVIYIGDSITDLEAFKLVRAKGGLTVSFNGNSYAVKNAEVAVISDSNLVTAVIADLFCKHGKERSLKIINSWNFEELKNSGVSGTLLSLLADHSLGAFTKVQVTTSQNTEVLIKESCEFRKKVRGVAIGRLG